ncbi:MAG: A/G-specific adenine glycosylase [Verrucomicrobiota bacterium]
MTPHEQKLIPAAAAFRKALLAWFARHQRPLPWRTEVSAYRTVVSELMCQQTQVATALPYFERWVARWPDFQSLARAQEADVLSAWAGLGYYTRARNLLALAQQVAGRPEPRTAAAWQAFKGVGPYTAAAIASIAFHEPVAVVDGNVVRVLARVGGVREKFKDTATAAKSFAPLANALVDPKRPGDHNQAMMELGATVCRKAAPDCAHCPVARWCAVSGRAEAAQLPRFESKVRKTAAVTRALVQYRGKILVRRNPRETRRLAGMAELPELVTLRGAAASQPVLIRRRTIGSVTYEETLLEVVATASSVRTWSQDAELEWVTVTDLDSVALTGPHLRWVREWLSLSDRPARGK